MVRPMAFNYSVVWQMDCMCLNDLQYTPCKSPVCVTMQSALHVAERRATAAEAQMALATERVLALQQQADNMAAAVRIA